MSTIYKNLRGAWLIIMTLLLLLVAAPGCSQMQPLLKTESGFKTERSTFPYDPLVYHLDLSVLSYKLYRQSLVWPYDPYFEIATNDKGGRKKTLDKVRSWSGAWAKTQVAARARSAGKLGGYRGPGILNGFDYNDKLDPIIYRYDKINPWSRNLIFADNLWTENQTPQKITNRIRDVYMCYRQGGKTERTVRGEKVTSKASPQISGADTLLAFEGGTGDKGEAGQPAAQSLMGFVLLRHLPDGKNYDVHISFRGSQSGSVKRAALNAFSQDSAGGNPDWVTDLGYDRVGPRSGGGHITAKGTVHRGFSTSMKSIYPQLFACLGRVAKHKPQRSPNNIYVTGHSLGGGLAQHFVSSVLLGGWYGPYGKGISMPSQLQAWPWRNVKLITFSAPRAGDAEWAEHLTAKGLMSDFFSSPLLPIDLKSLEADHPSIGARLLDTNQPVGYRVLISNDPISTEKVAGGKHVGQTIYANEASIFSVSTAEAHDPEQVRKLLVQKLNDPLIPLAEPSYGRIGFLNKSRIRDQHLKANILADRSAEIERYYGEYNSHFDVATFRREFQIYKSFIASE